MAHRVRDLQFIASTQRHVARHPVATQGEAQHSADDRPAALGHRHLALAGEFGEGCADVLQLDLTDRHFPQCREDVIGQRALEARK
ncbi:hypothetical protein D9M73_299160 [compost metagenome]